MSTTRSTRPPEPAGDQPGIPSVARNGRHAEPPRQPVLTGRTRELVLLHALLDQALAGTGGIAMLAGEPGIGKTRLIEELAFAARGHGAAVRWSRCYEDEGAPAYWPWVQVLRACVLDTDPDTLRAELAGGASVIAQIVPEIADRLPGLPPPPSLEPEQARFRLFDAVATFLHNAAAHRPLLLILDDLHWADTPSLLLLRFLSKEVRETPVLLAGAYRDVDLTRGHPLTQTMGELARVQACHRLTLHGLEPAEVARFIEAAAGHAVPERLAEAVYRRTEGNPFFLTEIVRLLIAEGRLAPVESREEAGVTGFLDTGLDAPQADTDPGIPQTVREAIDRRLDQLTDRCRAVLSVAAVLGLEFTLPALERVAAASGAGEGVHEALEEAEEARIVAGAAGGSGRYRFANALIRETVYEGLTTTRRVRLHRQVGEALESLWSGARDAHLGELASHFAQAAAGGTAERAVYYARRAAERATALTGYEEAARYYGMALHALMAHEPGDVMLRCDLVLELGEAHWKAGDGATARDAFRDAATLARAIPAPDQLGRAALGFARPDTLISGPGVVDGESTALLEEALAVLPVEDSPLRALLLARLAQSMLAPGGQQRRDTLSRAAVEMARRLGDPATIARTLIARHHALLGAPNVWDRFAAATAIIRLSTEAGDRELALQGHASLVLDLLELGDGAAVDEGIATCAGLCQELRQPVHAYVVATFRAMRALTSGQFAEAERLTQRALLMGQPVERQRAVHSYALSIFLIRRDQGRLAEVETGVQGFVERYPDLPGWRAALALLYAETGRLAEARTEFERLAEDGFAGLPRDAFWLTALAALSEVCWSLQDSARAARLYELLAPHDGHMIVAGYGTGCAGAAAYYLGILAATAGLPDAASRHLAEAADAHGKLGSPTMLARTRYAAARLHAEGGTAGGGEAARALVEEALHTAEALGMALLETQARDLLRQVTDADDREDAAGARIPRTVFPKGLTTREVEVLRLLAGGMTTREIAADLVLSVHTVTRHIANVYTKIGARNRADATNFAIQNGLA